LQFVVHDNIWVTLQNLTLFSTRRFNFCFSIQLRHQRPSKILVPEKLRHLLHLVSGHFPSSFNIFNILIHIRKRQVTDDSHRLPLERHQGLSLFTWRLEALLGLELEELLPSLLLLDGLGLSNWSGRESHLLDAAHHLSLLVGYGHGGGKTLVALIEFGGWTGELRALWLHHSEEHLGLLHLVLLLRGVAVTIVFVRADWRNFGYHAVVYFLKVVENVQSERLLFQQSQVGLLVMTSW
jgi:hypothetical protein